MKQRRGAFQSKAKPQVALGLRAHSGWAALVAVSGTPRAAEVLDRRCIELVDAGTPGSKQPYHAAQKWNDLKEAERLVQGCANSARLLAERAFRAILAELREKGYEVVGCGLLCGSGRPVTSLAATLASHAMIHTAEGELFRDALAHASESCDLRVTRVKERDLFAQAATQLRVSADALQRRLAELGRSLGPPWRQDEKYATLAAWLALAAPAHQAVSLRSRRPRHRPQCQ